MPLLNQIDHRDQECPVHVVYRRNGREISLANIAITSDYQSYENENDALLRRAVLTAPTAPTPATHHLLPVTHHHYLHPTLNPAH